MEVSQYLSRSKMIHESINNLRRALFVSLSNCCPVERSSLGKDVLRQLDKLAADLSHLSLSSWPSQECQVDQIAVDEVGNVWGTGTMMEQCQAQSMATFNNNHTNYADHDDNGGDVMQQTCQAENMFGVAMSPHLNNGNSGLCMLVADANRRRSFGDEPDSLLRYLDDADLGRAQQQLSAGYPMSSRLYRDRDTIVNGGANNSDNDDFAGWSSSETQLSPLSGFLSSAGISTTTASTAGTPASTVGAQCAESFASAHQMLPDNAGSRRVSMAGLAGRIAEPEQLSTVVCNKLVRKTAVSKTANGRPARRHPPMKTSLSTVEIDKYFSLRLADSSTEKVDLLTRLFDAIASPCAVAQLRDAIAQSRSALPSLCSAYQGSVKAVMLALDSLDATATASCLLRRWYLVHLLELKLRIEEEIKARRQRQAARRKRMTKHDCARIELLKTGRKEADQADEANDDEKCKGKSVGNQALKKMLSSVYLLAEGDPDGEKQYERTVSKVKSRLACARNWHRFACRFSKGALALIPSGGDYQISVDQVEKLRSSDFQVLLDVLDEKRGSFLRCAGKSIGDSIIDVLIHGENKQFNFENVAENEIRSKTPDSKDLLSLFDIKPCIT